MAAWKYTQQESCTIDDTPVKMRVCESCRFFRGASSSRHEPPDGVTFKYPHGWQICCNWPRDGMYIAIDGAGREPPGIEIAVTRTIPIPPIFLAAFGTDTQPGRSLPKERNES